MQTLCNLFVEVLIMKSKFFTTYGIEFSYLVPKQFTQSIINSHALDDVYVDMFTEEFKKKFKGQKFNHLEIHNDDVIEIAGPYFKSYSKMKKFHKGLAEVAEKLQTPTHRKDMGGGGGHIHAGIPEGLEGDQLLLFVANVHRDINNRPYLNYIFNEGLDDCNAVHVAFRHKLTATGSAYNRSFMAPSVNTFEKLKEHYSRYARFKYGYTLDGSNRDVMNTYDILHAFCDEESYMNAQSEYKTLEFRIFDAVYSEKQLKSHINFLNQYLKHIMAITKKGELIQTKYKNNKQAKLMCKSYRKPVKTRREFKALLDTLGLDYKDYKALFKRNYLERVAFDGQVAFN